MIFVSFGVIAYMKRTDFTYHLPEHLIAQHSIDPREKARMLVLDRKDQSFSDGHVRDLLHILKSGDVLVRNVTKVFKARLRAWFSLDDARKGSEESLIEVFLLRCVADIDSGGASMPRSRWRVLLKPSKKVQVEDDVYFGSVDLPSFGGDVVAHVLAKHDDGVVEVQFNIEQALVFEMCELLGEVPIPPYVKNNDARGQYQTAYAKEIGAVAAPTAGFHFNDYMLESLNTLGVQFVDVVLHVGIGTFRPIKVDDLDDHVMHAEWVEVSAEAVDAIALAKEEGRRVIAVGTTVVRALEGVYALQGSLQPYAGDVDVFISPGFAFHVVDGLLTNFHLPESSLLVMISAFAGREFVLQAYEHAVREEYRFYSFGDAMLIL